MKKMFLVAYSFAFSLAELMSMDSSNEKANQEIKFTIFMQVSEKLIAALKNEFKKFGENVKNVAQIEVLIDNLKDLNENFKERAKRKGKKALAGIKNFGG